MKILQKTHYALHAIFELALRKDDGLVKISDIAEAQSIPIRFLEVILNKLKHGGFVEAKRGYFGGYRLLRSPDKITVGSIVRLFQAEKKNIDCHICVYNQKCPFKGNCAFKTMWNKARKLQNEVYDKTTIQALIDSQSRLNKKKKKTRKSK